MLEKMKNAAMNNYQNHPLAGAVDLDTAFNKMWFFYKKYFLGLQADA
jgi:hypothetical protein